MTRLTFKLIKICVACILSSWLLPIYALTSDDQKPAHIQTNFLHNSNKDHITVLTGNVIMDQGTTHLIADQVFVYRNNNNLTTKIVATGKPAQYITLPDGKTTSMHASANTIIYYPRKHEMILQGNGRLQQQGSSMQGSYIRYNTVKQILISKQDKKTPTTIVIDAQNAK